MNEILNLISSVGTTPILGMGGVMIAIIGYSGFKIIKRKKHNKKFDIKSNLTNEAYKNNSSDDKNFDPDTYTVQTEDYTDNPKKVSSSVLRPRHDNIEDFLKEDLPLSGSATHDNNMRQSLVEQRKTKESVDTKHIEVPKYLTANPESRHYINKALDADKNNNKNKAIENIKIALEKEPHPSEKLRFSTILKNYTSRDEALLELFFEYPSFLAAEEELDFNLNINNQDNDDDSDFERAKAEAQLNHQEQFKYKVLPPGSADRFSHLDSDLAAPKITLSQQVKALPKILETPPDLPVIKADKSHASDINEFPAHDVTDDISNIFKKISQINTTTKDNQMTQNDKVAKGFNELLNQFTPEEPQVPAERKNPPNRLSYDIWVQWMTTANGKTSFKSSMFKLKNPWTSRKAIIELSEYLSEESKNSDGSKAAWSVISVNPFFDF